MPADVQKITVFSAGIASASKEPEAGKALIKFLASPAASYLSGQSIVVDGANTIQEDRRTPRGA